jgi:hypothetical protein
VKDSNRLLLSAMADRLGPLLNRVVFVGGCATGLLVTDPTAPAIRTTEDVDVITQVASYYEYQELAHELRRLGFAEDTREGAPLCRWVVDNMTLDFMATDPRSLRHWVSAAGRSRGGENRRLPLLGRVLCQGNRLGAGGRLRSCERPVKTRVLLWGA